jgi:hypothetical protein
MPLFLFLTTKKTSSASARTQKGKHRGVVNSSPQSRAQDAFEKAPVPSRLRYAVNSLSDAIYKDVQATLGVPRFKWLGFRFGAPKKVDNIQFFTDASGQLTGGEARVGGKRITLSGPLLARAIEAYSKQEHNRLAQTIRLAQSQASAPHGQTLEAADKRTVQQKRFALYCDFAAASTFYATEREVIAACETLGVALQVISEKPLKADGSYRYQVDKFIPTGKPDAPSYNLYLRSNHYEPLSHKITWQDASTGQATGLTAAALHDATGAQSHLVRSALKAAATPVPGDGSCFFHALATLLPYAAHELRAQSVAWLRTHGETYVRDLGIYRQPLIDDFLDGADPATRKAILAAYPEAASPSPIV